MEAAGRADHRRDLRLACRAAGAQRAQRDIGFRRRAGGRAERARGAAGGADLVARAGGARRRPQLDDAELWRDRGGRLHRRRCDAGARGQAPASPLGDRHRYLSADGGDPAGGDRRGRRLVLRSLGGKAPERELRAPHGRAHRDGHDRRRKPVRRALCRHCRGQRQRRAARRGRRRLCALCAVGGPAALRRAGLAQLQAHARDGRGDALTRRLPFGARAAKGAHLMAVPGGRGFALSILV